MLNLRFHDNDEGALTTIELGIYSGVLAVAATLLYIFIFEPAINKGAASGECIDGSGFAATTGQTAHATCEQAVKSKPKVKDTQQFKDRYSTTTSNPTP